MATRPPRRKAIARKPEPTPEEAKSSRKRTWIIMVSVVLAIIGVSIGIGYYVIYVAPFQGTIIAVNDNTINYDYFIRRMKYVDLTTDVFSELEIITDEELIRQGAPRYNIEVTDDEIDDLLREAARGENESISESEYRSWYRDQLNEVRLSDEEYREYVGTHILADHLHEYLAERTPTVTEQIHLYSMILATYEDAEAVKIRVEEGEDFADIARELSLDEESKEQGGDIGWWPEGALADTLQAMFYEDPGYVSYPIAMDEEMSAFAIFTVAERQAAREIEEGMLEILKEIALDDWLAREMSTNTITYHGRNNGFDSETYAWISWQISKE